MYGYDNGRFLNRTFEWKTNEQREDEQSTRRDSCAKKKYFKFYTVAVNVLFPRKIRPRILLPRDKQDVNDIITLRARIVRGNVVGRRLSYRDKQDGGTVSRRFLDR